MSKLVEAIAASQFPFPIQNVIHLFEGGSALHGARIEGKADLDICGVFIEPKLKIFGLDPFEHFVTSTAEQHERNTVDDTDITLYSLRRWAFLATKGNPTALSYLFSDNWAPNSWVWGYGVLGKMTDAMIAKSAIKHYIGFVDGQMARLLGTKGQGKHGQRPELTESHGYDTKAAMHAVRLLGEGLDLMQLGRVRFPRPNTEELISIRKGEWSLDKVCSRVSELISILEGATEKSSLRAKPDRAIVNECLVDAYETFYEGAQ